MARLWVQAVESQLREQALLVQRLLDGVSLGRSPIEMLDGAAIFVDDGGTRAANAEWRALFGPSSAGDPVDVPPELAESFERIRSDSSLFIPSLEVDRGGLARRVAVLLEERHKALADTNGIVAIAVDITAAAPAWPRNEKTANDVEEAARAAVEQANREKDRFLAAVSHELRAPLTTLLLWEKILRDDAADAQLREQAIEAIHQSAEQQARLVSDLLDVSRAISGKLFVDLRTLDVSSVLAAAVQSIAPALAAKHLELVPEIESAGQVMADAVRIRQVFDNLLSNAVKFTDAGGRVVVSSRRTGGALTIAIADTGRGIESELLDRLFEPFYQTDDLLTRAHGGLGLGLAIARHLITLHRGTIEASSDGPGRGATFTIRLPISDESRATPVPAATVRPPRLDHARVLVIDDDPNVRKVLAVVLQRCGARVDTASSAEHARLYLMNGLPDVIVCDIAMPGETGYDFVRKLRMAGVRTPAIALTAHAGDLDAKRSIAAGFDLHLVKPIDSQRLATCIGDVLRPNRDD